MRLSGVILAKNEETSIANCIQSLSFCSEIVVIDDYSDDSTNQIAMGLGCRVYKRKLNSNYASQRNFALRKTKSDWILFVDADEIVSVKLNIEVGKAILSEDFSGYYIRRLDIFKGKLLRHGEVGNTKIVRLARKNLGNWVRRVHEIWKIDGKVGTLREALIHNPHPDVNSFLEKTDRYSTLHAKANHEEQKEANIPKVVVYPFLKFIYNYVFLRGFLDGVRGLVYATLMSFHSFLSWSKLWMSQRK